MNGVLLFNKLQNLKLYQIGSICRRQNKCNEKLKFLWDK